MTMDRLWVAALVVGLATTTAGFGQTAADKKSYTFHGKVEAIDKKAERLTVDGEKVDGWMDAMTMDYRVDDPSILDKVKPGDRISATVYAGDSKLHKVQVVGKTDGDSKSKK